MIQIEGLSKVYGTRARTVSALREVSLSMGPGVWGVVGPNGAGKTTLLGLILGFLHPSGGSVAIDGRSPRRYLRRHGAVYLPERFSLPAPWTVRSALHALSRLEGHGRREAAARGDAALDRMGLGEYAERPVGELSRGLTQRVGLAQALLAERRLVVLDEPTEGLDPLWRIRFRELVGELRQGDRTVLLASHDLAEVERLSDRVVVLRDGQITEVMEARPRGGPRRFRLSVDGPAERVRAAFPSLEDYPEAGSYVVDVADPGELSHRLAALLDAGGVLHAVVPISDDLESRVRKRLEER